MLDSAVSASALAGEMPTAISVSISLTLLERWFFLALYSLWKTGTWVYSLSEMFFDFAEIVGHLLLLSSSAIFLIFAFSIFCCLATTNLFYSSRKFSKGRAFFSL